jgi:hypothetical protein
MKAGLVRESRNRNPKPIKIDEVAMEAAERHYAKAEALTFGAGKLLAGTEHSMWGAEIVNDVAMQLLCEAKEQRREGRIRSAEARAPLSNPHSNRKTER